MSFVKFITSAAGVCGTSRGGLTPWGLALTRVFAHPQQIRQQKGLFVVRHAAGVRAASGFRTRYFRLQVPNTVQAPYSLFISRRILSF